MQIFTFGENWHEMSGPFFSEKKSFKISSVDFLPSMKCIKSHNLVAFKLTSGYETIKSSNTKPQTN